MQAVARAQRSHWSVQQQDATNAMLRHFSSGNRYVMLLAMMQCGKTKTYHAVIREMLKPGALYGIKRVYILCGTMDTDLYKQAEQDAVDNNSAACPRLFEYWGPKDARHARAKQRGYFADDDTIKVIFLQDMDASLDVRDSLIVLDESHLDQDSDQMVAALFKRHNIHLSGQSEFMQENNIFLLSVSATPFSEIALYLRGKHVGKQLVVMKQPDGHYGVPQYLRDKRVRQAVSLRHPLGRAIFSREIRGRNLYNLVRINHEEEYDALLEVCSTEGFDIKEYSSEREDIDIAAMEMAPPAVPTIILVKGRLRCGKVVPKRHINLVWETSIEPRLDTILQSFLGRMCGYESAFGAHKPLIYIPRCALAIDPATKMSELDRYVYLFNRKEEEEWVLPSSGRNCHHIEHTRDHTRWAACAFRVPTAPQHVSASASAALKAEIVAFHDYDIIDQLNADPDEERWTAYEKKQIMDILYSPQTRQGQVAFRDFGKRNAAGELSQAKEANLLIARTDAGDRIDACHQITGRDGDAPVAYVRICDDLGSRRGSGHTYIIFQLEHRDHLPAALRLPYTTGKEMFNMVTRPKNPVEPRVAAGAGGQQDPLPVVHSLIGSCHIGISDAASESKEELETQFNRLLRTLASWHREGGEEEMSNCLSATVSGRALYFNKEVFGSSPQLRYFLQCIGARYGATVFINLNMPMSQETSQLYLNEIRWVFSD